MGLFDTWREQFVECAGFAFRIEDLRERAIRSDNPLFFNKQIGITFVKELMIQRTVFETMSSMGWSKESINMERRYELRPSKNLKRADFAIKDPEARRGRSWHYIELKSYNTSTINLDLEKLAETGSKRANRNHMLIYRTTTRKKTETGETYLLQLLKKNYKNKFKFSGPYGPIEHDFGTLVPSKYQNKYSDAVQGRCEIVLITLR